MHRGKLWELRARQHLRRSPFAVSSVLASVHLSELGFQMELCPSGLFSYSCPISVFPVLEIGLYGLLLQSEELCHPIVHAVRAIHFLDEVLLSSVSSEALERPRQVGRRSLAGRLLSFSIDRHVHYHWCLVLKCVRHTGLMGRLLVDGCYCMHRGHVLKCQVSRSSPGHRVHSARKMDHASRHAHLYSPSIWIIFTTLRQRSNTIITGLWCERKELR